MAETTERERQRERKGEIVKSRTAQPHNSKLVLIPNHVERDEQRINNEESSIALTHDGQS